MLRLIPGKTKVQVELFKGVSIGDIFVGGIFAVLCLLIFVSTLPGKLYILMGVLFVAALLLMRSDTEPNYLYLLHILRHFGLCRRYGKHVEDEELKISEEEEEKVPAHKLTAAERKAKAKAERMKKERERRKAESEQETRDYIESEIQPNPEIVEAVISKKELKKQLKRERLEALEDEKLLKNPHLSDEQKDAIFRRQEARNKAAAERAEKAKKQGSKKDIKTQAQAEAARVAAEKAQAAKNAAADAQDKRATDIAQLIPFTDIRDDMICYDGKYYGIAIEIPPVEFRFFSESRRFNAIENALGRTLRSVPADYAVNIVKLERPIVYDTYLDNEYDKLDDIRASYEKGMISELEMQRRVEVLYDRINDLRTLCYQDKVVQPNYYLVMFDSDRQQLQNTVAVALDTLQSGEMQPHRLNNKELAVFLKYSNQIDFDERDVDTIDPKKYAMWAMPKSLSVTPRTIMLNHIITHNMRIVSYPSVVDDAWLASVLSMPATKVMIKCTPMDRGKSIRGIDRSIQELRGQYNSTGVDSRRLELAEHIQTLNNLLAMLRGDNEMLMEVNVYVTAYDIHLTRQYTSNVQPPQSCLSSINNLKHAVRRVYQEQNLRLNNMEFDQINAFIGGQVSAWDPMRGQGRGIPSNSIAAGFPWIFSHVSDKKGIKLGSESGVPVFIDFFRRDSERVNSNMVIVGKSGSGKSYATKSLLTNLAADDSKIFILDPENEYAELAENLHGKFINVGNAQYGRLNPFHIITSLEDDESGGNTVSSSYATHLQFLEEFFRQILPDCEKDAMEYLNSLIDRMYTNKGITPETNLSLLSPEDYPIFDDLYDAILTEFQATDNEYIRTMLRTLMNYVAKFSTGGRNANIWNGPSTVTTEENFTVFNFQSLLANRNGSIANAQMLLVLKYIDNEIIKNREYNNKYKLARKVVVVIDEAHVFIDTKFPVALDFMFQLAKRIRKYNGMQIVITQNIKDFVGSEEIARKSTAIINACQYSFIFSLSPNDIGDLCTLYEKAGGINESEQEQIVSAPRGQAFIIMSPQSRSTFKVEVPEDVVAMFQEKGYESRYFIGDEGEKNWSDFLGDSREIREANAPANKRAAAKAEKTKNEEPAKSRVTFMEFSEQEFMADRQENVLTPKEPPRKAITFEEEDDPFPDTFDIPDDPAEFQRKQAQTRPQAESVSAPVIQQAAISTPAPQATAPAPVNAPVPQVVVQAPPSNGETERILSELLSKLSYESLREEIRRSVLEELEREKNEVMSVAAANQAAIAQAAAAQNANNEKASETAETGAGSEVESESESEFESETDSEFAYGPSTTQVDTNFDVMALLDEESSQLDGVSPIDLMVTYDEDQVEITLEELAMYIRNQAKAS